MAESQDGTFIKLPSLLYDPGSEPDEAKIVQHHSIFTYVNLVEKKLGLDLFSRLEDSFLKPVIEMSRKPGLVFSGKLFHFLMQRKILTNGEDLWFRFGSQPMRFSAREFFFVTGIPSAKNSYCYKVFIRF